MVKVEKVNHSFDNFYQKAKKGKKGGKGGKGKESKTFPKRPTSGGSTSSAG